MITDRGPTHHGRKGALETLPAPKDLYTFNSYCARVFLQWCSHLQVVHGPGVIPIKFIGTFELHLRRSVSLFLSSMPYMDYVEFVHISEKVHTISTIWQSLPIYRKNPLLFLSSWKLFPQKWMIYTLKSYQILAPTGKNVTEQLLHKSHWVREKDGEVKMWNHEYPWQEELIRKDDDNIRGAEFFSRLGNNTQEKSKMLKL